MDPSMPGTSKDKIKGKDKEKDKNTDNFLRQLSQLNKNYNPDKPEEQESPSFGDHVQILTASIDAHFDFLNEEDEEKESEVREGAVSKDKRLNDNNVEKNKTLDFINNDEEMKKIVTEAGGPMKIRRMLEEHEIEAKRREQIEVCKRVVTATKTDVDLVDKTYESQINFANQLVTKHIKQQGAKEKLIEIVRLY